MKYIEIPDGFMYKSWIKLEEEAEKTIMKLEQHNRIFNIADIDSVYVNSTLVLDTTIFKDL